MLMLKTQDLGPFSVPAFDFGSYMADRAKLVNDALDQAVPLKYPEDLTESMRFVIKISQGLYEPKVTGQKQSNLAS